MTHKPFAVLMFTLLFAVSSAFAQTTNRITGRIVYTAVLEPGDTLNGQIEGAGTNAVLITNTVGADAVTGREHILGGDIGTAVSPNTAQQNELIVIHAYEDLERDGSVDERTTTPILVVTNPDDSVAVTLTTEEDGAAVEPSWSPDSSQVVFAIATEDTNKDGFLTATDRRQLALLDITTEPEVDVVSNIAILPTEEISVANPVFAKDNLIVFDATINNVEQVHTYNLETQELIPLVNAPGQTRTASPSPDGNRVVVEVTENGRRYVAVHNFITNTWERISPPDARAYAPHWVDDKISYIVRRGTQSQIFVWDGTTSSFVTERDEVITTAKLAHLTDALAYTYISAENKNTVLAVASLDGVYQADLSPVSSNITGFDWTKTDLFTQ